MDQRFQEHVGQSLSMAVKTREFIVDIRNYVRQYSESEGTLKLNDRTIVISRKIDPVFLRLLPPSFTVTVREDDSYHAYCGCIHECETALQKESYALDVHPDGIVMNACDYNGLCYGVLTMSLLLGQKDVSCCSIKDYPALPYRGLMLDVSRGKTYKLCELKRIIDILALARYNVFQLYIEHTFAFECHRQIWEGSDPYTREDILEIKEYCRSKGISLQGNLQSFGHAERILTRKEFSHLRESDMFWTLSPAVQETYELLGELYDEYMPLFDDEYFNVCSDETYDLGSGKSRDLCSSSSAGEVYRDHLLRLHSLASRHSKKIMVFGDIIIKHSELISSMPDDVVYLDWIYDPKDKYETPEIFAQSGKSFWVCPGTGQWNSLFPRLDGALMNIEGLVLTGMDNGAQGMLLTDWNDHGGYAVSVFASYSYVFAGLVSWLGCRADRQTADQLCNMVMGEDVYSSLMHLYASIYYLPPIWSKNRSECVMALFDEPVFGKAVRGKLPPEGLEAYNLRLPAGVSSVLEPHAKHPLRPYFSIPETTVEGIRTAVHESEALIAKLHDEKTKSAFTYVHDAFLLMADKLDLSRKIISKVSSGSLGIEDYVRLEDEVRVLIKRFVRLELSFTALWRLIARDSEIEIPLTYFANIISRLDYLRSWLAGQRESVEKGYEADSSFETYDTCGYTTLPTF